MNFNYFKFNYKITDYVLMNYLQFTVYKNCLQFLKCKNLK